MAKIDKIKEGDLVVSRANKKPYIVLEIQKYHKRSTAQDHPGSMRKSFYYFFQMDDKGGKLTPH